MTVNLDGTSPPVRCGVVQAAERAVVRAVSKSSLELVQKQSNALDFNPPSLDISIQSPPLEPSTKNLATLNAVSVNAT